MTLEDAFRGLLEYWGARPSGGTRAELVALAVQRGFQEPLLNEWLDVFLAGFVECGYIAVPDYDAALAPRVAEVGVATASRAAAAVFQLLTQQGDRLDVIRKQNAVAFIDAQLVTLANQRELVSSGRAAILSTFPSSAARTATVTAVDFALAHQDRLIASATERRDQLVEEIALLTAGG